MEIPASLRRFITIPILFFLAVALTMLGPLWLALLLCVGCLRPHNFVLLRITCFAWLYTMAQVYGVLSYALLRIRYLFRSELCTKAMYRLQTRWTSVLFWGASVLLSIRLTVTGEDALNGGPITLLFRHSSLVDTLLPGVCIARTTRLQIRYVLKKELLWDPCLDLVGNYLPNYFVDRSGDSQAESRNITALSTSLTENDAVLIYPEGTRFSKGKRARILKRWSERNDPRLHFAKQFTHVLPPKATGVHAIRQGCANSDVVFCAHAGLEQVTNIKTLLSAAVQGLTVRVHFWRVPHRLVPIEAKAQHDWLFQEWLKMNSTVLRLKDA